MRKAINTLVITSLILTIVSLVCFYFVNYFPREVTEPQLVDFDLALIGFAAFAVSLALSVIACYIRLIEKSKV